MGRLRRLAGRIAGAIRLPDLGALLVGGQGGGGPSAIWAMGVYRKLIAAAVGGALSWLHVRFGWDLAGFFGDDFEVGLIEAITAYLVWRLPNASPAAGAQAPQPRHE